MIQSMIEMKTLTFQLDSPIGRLAHYKEPSRVSDLIANCTECFFGVVLLKSGAEKPIDPLK